MKILESSKLKAVLQIARKSFIYVGSFSFLINLLMLTIPLYMLQIFDRVITSQSYDTLIYLSIIAVTALLVLSLLDVARSWILVRISHWMDNNLSPFALTQSADETLGGSQYGSQSLRDIGTIRQFLSGHSIFSLFDAPWVPVYLAVIFMLKPFAGIIATAGAALLFALALVNELVTRKPLALANAQSIKTHQYVSSTLGNAETIQAMGMLPSIVRKWFGENEKTLHLQSEASKRSSMILSLSKFLRMVLQLAILGTGAFFVIRGEMTPGAMIAASILMARALAPVEQAMGTWKQLMNCRQAYARLKVYLNRKSSRAEGISLPEPTGQVSVENIIYMAPGTNKPILQGVNFQLNPGETLAVVGPSGAGKSTLARLLLGIWAPNHGTVRLDGASVYDWERTDFGKHVGYLPQDIELFNGDIKSNIARMDDENLDEEAVIKAAQQAGAHDLILHLPNGYEFTTSAFSLSGGQRQRIALARAFYGDPCFVVLDEPNASLDNDGDIALNNALLKAKEKGTTVVIISHRPNIVQVADKILLLNQGKMQAFGPREQVLSQLQQMNRPAVQPTGETNV